MKKTKRKITETPPAPPPAPALDWRDVAAVAWAVGVLAIFVGALGNAGVLALLGQLLTLGGS